MQFKILHGTGLSWKIVKYKSTQHARLATLSSKKNTLKKKILILKYHRMNVIQGYERYLERLSR